MRFWIASVLICVIFSLPGCMKSPRRFMNLELATPQGHWRLNDVARAAIECQGWEVRILRSKINDLHDIAIIEELEFEIVNTSPSRNVYIEPREIFFSGFDRPMWLGPARTVVLMPGQKWLVSYSPGLRAEKLPYPVLLTITVFRRQEFEEPDTVRFYIH